MRNLPWIDITIITILVMYALSGGHAFGHVPFHVAIKLIPYALVFFLVKTLCLSDTGNRLFLPCAVSFICGLGIFETIIGILQVLGVRHSNNSFFAITGTLNNPGPYGGLIAVVLSIAVSAYLFFAEEPSRLHRIVRGLCLVTIFLCTIVLPASMSRAGWLAFAIAVMIMAIRKYWGQQPLMGHIWKYLTTAVLSVLLCAGAFMMKKESALGRMHMWDIECRAILNRPLFGYGPGRQLGAYGEAQAEYFERGDRPWIRKRLAGSPQYTFNEYLRIGMEAGMPAMILALLIILYAIVSLLKRNNPIAYGLVAQSVFAAFSYPLSSMVHCCLLTSMLAIASAQYGSYDRRMSVIAYSRFGIVMASSAFMGVYAPYAKMARTAEQKWNTSQGWLQMHRYDLSAEDAATLYPVLKYDYRFLYDYGRALFETGQHEKSIAILQEGALLSSDPAFHLMIGRNQEVLGESDLARDRYLHAHFMTPGRLYPLKLLMECQVAAGDTVSAVITAREALAIPVNEKNMTMHNLHSQIENNLQKSCHVEQ